MSDHNKNRVTAPKRRPATTRFPGNKLPSQSPLSCDKLTFNFDNVPSPKSEARRSSLHSPGAVGSNGLLAASALAGLASKEDLKSAATSLRSSTVVENDSWRQFDLKNSLQTIMLILVKGRRRAHVRLIEPSWRRLNNHDSFILVTKNTVYAYIGQYSNIIERAKCSEVAQFIHKQRDLCHRNLYGRLVTVDGKVEKNIVHHLKPMVDQLSFNAASDEVELKNLLEASDEPDETFFSDDDKYYEELTSCSNMIYKVVLVGAGNSVAVNPIESSWGRSPSHNILNNNEAFIFDYGAEMYVWIGKDVSNHHRKCAVEAAKDLWLKGYDYTEFSISPFGSKILKADARPDWAWFTRVNQNLEPILFKDKFINWPAFTVTRSLTKKEVPSVLNEIKPIDSHRSVKKDLSSELNLFAIDVEREMINKHSEIPALSHHLGLLGRGAGFVSQDEDGFSIKVFTVDYRTYWIDEKGCSHDVVDDMNVLHTGESYYIRWKYYLESLGFSSRTRQLSEDQDAHCGRERLCYFIWQGRHTFASQRGQAALKALNKMKEEDADQVLVENGHENPAFLRVFQGSLIILLGKRAVSVESIPRTDAPRQTNYRMLTLKTPVREEAFLVEVPCSVENLRSRASFLFISIRLAKVYLWHGCKVATTQKDLFRNFLHTNVLDPENLTLKTRQFGLYDQKGRFDIHQVDEGKEPKDFCDVFVDYESGSQRITPRKPLQRDMYFSLMDDKREYQFTPRLFHLISSPDKGFESIEIISSYHLPKKSSLVSLPDESNYLAYPFTQDDLYEIAKKRPTFFLLDNCYEVFLWESKHRFNCSECDNLKENKKLSHLVEEIETDSLLTTGSTLNVWTAERQCALETALAYCHGNIFFPSFSLCFIFFVCSQKRRGTTELLRGLCWFRA